MFFEKARPIYAKGLSEEKNTFVAFETVLPAIANAELHIAAATFYRAYLDNRFLASGPARTVKNYDRVDVLSLGEVPENSILRIEVAGYFCMTISNAKKASYLCAEVFEGERSIASTGNDFKVLLPHTRVRVCDRFSMQRHFTEVWDFSENKEEETDHVVLEAPKFLLRRAPYPDYHRVSYEDVSAIGTFTHDSTKNADAWFYSGNMDSRWGTFDLDDIPEHPYKFVKELTQTPRAEGSKLPVSLSAGEYAMIDLKAIHTGFYTLEADCSEKSEIIFAFSEDKDGEKFAFTDIHCLNTIRFTFAPGKTGEVISFEPYTGRYAMICVLRGKLTVTSLGMITFEHPKKDARLPRFENETLNGIADGALNTFVQNAVDIYSDCPSRERAGWLCDSYFTSKSEYFLFGNTQVEDDFLQNFLLYSENPDPLIPSGMLPMTCPTDIRISDKRTGYMAPEFIPQWAMWFVLETDEYLRLRNPKADREAFIPVIRDLITYLSTFENKDGLLENVAGWNFVEWSVANEWTKNVNYPTNFLYSAVLDAFDRIAGTDTYRQKAEHIREVAKEQSFFNGIFHDHAERKADGSLVPYPHASEAAQYYAVLFGDLDYENGKYAYLDRLITNVFGAERTEEHPEIAEINAFIGAYLRLEALLKLKKYDKVLTDVCDFFGNMANETGTLWEYRQRHGSRCHGFASYAVVAAAKAQEALKG